MRCNHTSAAGCIISTNTGFHTSSLTSVTQRKQQPHLHRHSQCTLKALPVSDTPTHKVSVRKLVEFSCKTGDLIHDGVAGPTSEEGQKAHKKLQSKLQAGQQAEVKVGTVINSAGNTLAISGRVDIFQSTADQLILGEIKSCYAPVEKISTTTRALHWAQLKMYGYCAMKQSHHRSATLQLLWFNVVTDEVHVEEQILLYHELEAFARAAADQYLRWMQLIESLSAKTTASAQALSFPHEQFRAGQREMAGAIYVTAREKGTLLCEAPTGIGKTISALFPAAKALGADLIESTVYLTAKTSGRESANEALSLLARNGLFITAVTITSKKTTCHCTNGTCDWNSEGRCPLTIGFFDRLPEARDALIQTGIITPAAIDEAAHRYQLCPFELTLQLLPWVDLVVCDFNYVFDPLVRLSHFTEAANKKLLLVDESHNLIDRARSMYSAQLEYRQMLQASRESTAGNPFLAKAFKSVANAIQRVARTSDEPEFAHDDTPDTVNRAVKKCGDALTSTIENHQPLTETAADAAKEIYRYLVIAELFGDHHKAISTKSPGAPKHSALSLQCLNATDKLAVSFRQFRAAAVFSATLRPQHYFRESLGLPESTGCLSLPSPFAPQQQGTFVCEWIDTRYRARKAAMEPLVSLAHKVFTTRPGNYQIFFPSYAFMESVHTAFERAHPDIPTLIQQRRSTDEQRQQFLHKFQSEQQLLAFSILGGIYGEGIDYVGDKLIGTIIVGTGLASINLQQKLIEQDYTAQGLNGFEYASQYPGFTRVLQTAGRVIRSEQDHGIVVLADHRFTDPFYRDLYPAQWQLQRCRNDSALDVRLHEFWAEHFSLTGC